MRVHAFTACNVQDSIAQIGAKVRSKCMFNNVSQYRREISVASRDAVHEAKQHTALRIKSDPMSTARDLLGLLAAVAQTDFSLVDVGARAA
ncbi:MAG TPA: hypothetical protein VMV87_01160 [Burkholderiales bacterium]|nr:hypothetical protein [Burkholderiales bacterium]